MSTVAVDIGGSSIKVLALNDQGAPVTETLSQPTPVPAAPVEVFALIRDMADTLPPHRRVSVGFPGIVKNGVAQNAPNLGDELWRGVELNERLTHLLQRPVRAVNDADLQGLGVVRGKGVELVVTLGTGMGAALFTEGVLVPNLELGHHPLRDGHTYEDLVRDSELKR
ncbi:MAG: ROK family protein, partial [Deltaproteobacteria bacterium]|nr:ROK family protein [Deltaproteobacteria bacterium]